MMNSPSRRAVLAGMGAVAGHAALAEAPLTTERPLPRGVVVPREGRTNALVANSGVNGAVTFALADAETGEMLDMRQQGRPMPPASTLKAVTSIYALDRLGRDFQFETKVLADGKIVDGELRGDLWLVGGGDPTLTSDGLADLAKAVAEAGISRISGTFFVWADALPRSDRIDSDQPDVVAYNPSYGGLNLNFNRVHFEWIPDGDEIEITMQARALRFSPETNVARMRMVDRPGPVYEYKKGLQADYWSVARDSLGKKPGARWLPVRFPALYAGDAFRAVARLQGLKLPFPEVAQNPAVGRVIASTSSEKLEDVLTGMMRYSTNLTAEAVGMAASLVNGVPLANLIGSGSRMAGWAQMRFGTRRMTFRDHSGLGYDSEINAQDMVDILRQGQDCEGLMKSLAIADPGRTDGKPMEGVSAVAKTGTLNFVSSLVGYIYTKSGRKLVFAIFTADKQRRDSIPTELRERPPGSRSWANRSRRLQKGLLAEWAEQFERA
ncbi:D-alanyl-D-alanine carboxypeptidase/D-alanyl-D-alanine endopeptidase [Boseongicola aestuarii]|uniref:D-alanyl-D-alanine carboxypeptidase DacC n=1 Tax=Boseongicola aestuarii TaxID=1470561 RepID=A0A238J2G0_9RHOB|nr:D-alanyl-D-alanine carboxypeptidase/D-alanyl-D-alanine-endopeptidase [Boseongicola aestuarii]SMX24084.1 D-alanyl-D-alanine carboxypeptidase DacC precursor [Boseongicola aestuarii]